MEKIIKISQNDNNIIVRIDDEHSCTISKDTMQLKAQQIYDLLDYKLGDKYKCELLDSDDNIILEKIKKLISEIINELNTIETKDIISDNEIDNEIISIMQE